MFKSIPGSSWSWSMNIQTMNKLKYKSIFISLTSLFAIWFPCFLLCRFIVLVTVILFWNVENSQSRMNRCVQTCDYLHTWLKRRSTRFLSLNRLIALVHTHEGQDGIFWVSIVLCDRTHEMDGFALRLARPTMQRGVRCCSAVIHSTQSIGDKSLLSLMNCI